LIRTTDTKTLAAELQSRYEPIRAVTIMGRLMEKALFAGKSDEVLFWALVHAHYRGGDLCDATEQELSVFSEFILHEPSEVN
jgi:hypothetical protein